MDADTKISTDRRFTVRVSKTLDTLIPGFLERRRTEVETLSQHLRAGEFAQIEMIGHRMHGHGESMGFPTISAIGAELESAAGESAAARIESEIARYAQYLERVDVEYQ